MSGARKFLMNRFVILLSCFVFIVGGALCGVPAQGTKAAPTLPSLQKELADTRARIDALQGSMAERAKELREQQHAIEYGNPEIMALREEMLALERQLLEKRKNLQVQIALQPEIKKVEEQRRQLFQELQKLRSTEAAIQREITALETKQD